ncbi:DNA-3-methyladenine glycosylase family protein [Pseudonocardia endophytica]|uniref:DNA-3-methyladenine glycosylase II n=1 Tax=Pseudonocardia endophytica TaxID=401976 RepID=A0A4R1HXG1_PSEEN|nr:DNA-3-methyladenine glycosylase 2 family protein [Pseudonocardia endophytica]TCK26171.1 DNA-3-methyladenine glycosylase II [Pseudonocardia endophytica]
MSNPIDLPATPPFDFAKGLGFVCAFPATRGEQDVDDGVLRDAVRAAGRTVGLRIRASGDGLRVEPSTEDPVARKEIAGRIRERFGLDDDLVPLYDRAATDPPFAAVVERLHGYHQVRFGSPLELLCWAVLCQRTPMPVARRAKAALVAACGNEVEVDGVVLRAFPDLEQLLGFTEAELVELVGNERKGRFLAGALRGWAELDEDFLRHGDQDAVDTALRGLPGIGPWSSMFLMIRGLGRTERAEPDREALAAATRVYGYPVRATEFTRLAEHYGDQRGYWMHYLRVG